jgi:hypothetical protein
MAKAVEWKDIGGVIQWLNTGAVEWKDAGAPEVAAFDRPIINPGTTRVTAVRTTQRISSSYATTRQTSAYSAQRVT